MKNMIYITQDLCFLYTILNGKVIGFSGRIINSGKQNKYLNTKETNFKKGKLLYHYHIAEKKRG